MRFVFNERKAAQTAAQILGLQGSRMPYIKLVQLLYLADRQSLIETGYTVTGDRLVASHHGPALGRILDLITWGPVGHSVWQTVVSSPENYNVSLLTDDAGSEELSEYEIALLADVNERYGHMDRSELLKYTRSLPEWGDPVGESAEIDARVILREAGKSDDEIKAISAQVEAIWTLRKMFATAE